jgi:hypothetical protein
MPESERYSKNDLKELDILREAVDHIENNMGKRLLMSDTVIRIIEILEDFLRKKKLVCYGGTAINNILPIEDQFYNKDIELPDYDFFSPTPIKHVKELAEIYKDNGFIEIEAKAGMHHGTYKLYVNFMPIADITHLVPELFKYTKRESIRIDGIMYAPPDFLRMSMYLELSRPHGDVSRWEKILKRLILFNKHYPIKAQKCIDEFSREYKGKQDASVIIRTIRDTSSNLGLVLFGGFAMDLYKEYLPRYKKNNFSNPDFDILSEDPLKSARIIKERLLQEGIKNIKLIKKPGVGEIISVHYEVIVDKDTVAFIYKPIACHSYNTINIGNKKLKIASIDTMLSMYMAFTFVERPYYNKARIFCMTQYLFDIQMRNRFKQKGLLTRFGLACYGHQETLEDIRAEKALKFKELSKTSTEYEEWFMKYTPTGTRTTKTVVRRNKSKKKKGKTRKR